MAPHLHRRPVYQSLVISRNSSCSRRLTSKNGDEEGLPVQNGLSWRVWHRPRRILFTWLLWHPARILFPSRSTHRRGPIDLWRRLLRLQTPGQKSALGPTIQIRLSASINDGKIASHQKHGALHGLFAILLQTHTLGLRHVERNAIAGQRDLKDFRPT